MTEKTLTTENIKPALDALRGELAPWPVMAMKQDRLNDTQKSAVNSGITSSLVAQIIANTAAIRALESAITGTGLRPLVVASLPAIGTQGILYIVPVTIYDPETDADVVNYSNEYLWIVAPDAPVTEGYYEQVGQTGIVINNGQLNITVNNVSVGTFTANQSGDTTAAITVPTNADYVDLSTSQTVTGGKTWTGEQSFTLPIVGSITGTASKAIADEDGTSIKTGYVNVAGNQTVSGQKTWSGNQFFTSGVYQKNNNYTLGNTVTDNQTVTYSFADSVYSAFGYCRSVIYETSNTTSTELAARNKFKNGALDPTGSVVTAQFFVRLDSDGNKYIAWDGSVNNGVTPYATNSYSLGSSSYQWSSVYAQSYYYNGTAWGLDQANTWTNDNQFNGSNMLLKNGLKEVGSANSGGHYTIAFWDKNNERMGWVQHLTEYIRIGCRNKFTNNVLDPNGSWKDNYITIYVKNDGTKSTAFLSDTIPEVNNAYNLGTSTNKWKTLNGINPGALSLPDYDNVIAIDTTNWSVPGNNNYTPALDGWLCVITKDSATSSIFIFSSGITMNRQYAGSVYGNGSQGSGRLSIMLPVRANVQYTVILRGDSVSDIYSVRFFPCLGNV